MKKRLLIALLCLLLAVSACGKTEIRPTADEPAAETEPQTLSFETTDLNGNAVSSEELFSSHQITMVNVMTTWCTYCIQELPELQELSESYASRGCAVVGLLYDGTDDALIETGKTDEFYEEKVLDDKMLCRVEKLQDGNYLVMTMMRKLD